MEVEEKNLNSELIVYVPTYYDSTALKRCVESNTRLGFRTLVGLGRFEGFTNLGSATDDKPTMELIEKHKCIWFNLEPSYEQDKLNQALKLAHHYGYKWVLISGSDDYLEGDSREFMINVRKRCTAPNPAIYKIKVIEHNPNSKYAQKQTEYPKLFHNIDQMEARHLHWMIFPKGSRFALKPNLGAIDGIVCHHDDLIRSVERNQLMEQFQDWNIPRERDVFYKEVKRV